MTREEALKRIEELKAYVEELDKEIPQMPNGSNIDECGCEIVSKTKYGLGVGFAQFRFDSVDTKTCYIIKAFELAHLMYARNYVGEGDVKHLGFVLYFDKDHLEYRLFPIYRKSEDVSARLVTSNRDWHFNYSESAVKVMNYMNKYVKDIVKELY